MGSGTAQTRIGSLLFLDMVILQELFIFAPEYARSRDHCCMLFPLGSRIVVRLCSQCICDAGGIFCGPRKVFAVWDVQVQNALGVLACNFCNHCVIEAQAKKGRGFAGAAPGHSSAFSADAICCCSACMKETFLCPRPRSMGSPTAASDAANSMMGYWIFSRLRTPTLCSCQPKP